MWINRGNSNVTPAGIIVTETNNRIIPATRRPDGSLRKERRVRPGYIPQEDIAIYKNRFVAKREHAKRIEYGYDGIPSSSSSTTELQNTTTEGYPFQDFQFHQKDPKIDDDGNKDEEGLVTQEEIWLISFDDDDDYNVRKIDNGMEIIGFTRKSKNKNQ